MVAIKRLSYLLLVLLMLGCSTRSEKSKELEDTPLTELPDPVDIDLEEIKKRGYLTAIVDNSSTGYFIYRGQPMGYEYELLQRLAKHLGVELQVKVTTGIAESFQQLQRGEGDIIAYNLTVTKERKKHFAFTDSHYSTRQVLVQKKPANWRRMSRDEVERSLIRNQVDLIGKEVYVRKNSSFAERLENLSDEIGGDIIIVEEGGEIETEALIRNVQKGKYKYTIADETVARVNASYYPELDVKTPVSFPQQIAWALRKNSPELLSEINTWMRQMKRAPTFNVIYNKYYNNNRRSNTRRKSDYFSMEGGQISPYDSLLKVAADSLGWDWRLLASQMYQESRFDPSTESWAGAVGLMQVVPATGAMYGYKNLYHPETNVKAATAHLKYLIKHWNKYIDDPEQHKKFVLASYNVGLGHVIDARALARKNGEPDDEWDVIAKYLLLKSKPEYFRDPVVKSGYCRGSEPVNYVRQILNRYRQYVQVIS